MTTVEKKRLNPLTWVAALVLIGLAVGLAVGTLGGQSQNRSKSPVAPPESSSQLKPSEASSTGLQFVDESPSHGTDNFFFRDPAEWQGMRINMDRLASCGESGICGMALACVGGKCVPCTSDDECESGEVCSLDHCVLESQADCRSFKDCDAGLCLLTGYSSDPRGNIGMKAYCSTDKGGFVQDPESEPRPIIEEAPERTMSIRRLQERMTELIDESSPSSVSD